MNREKFLALVEEIPSIFDKITESRGIIPVRYYISNDNFQSWRVALKYQLNSIKEEEIVNSVLNILENVDRGVSKADLGKLKANLVFIAENLDEFVPPQVKNSVAQAESVEAPKNISSSKKVFVVHGHDGEVLSKTARFLEKQDFQAIILHEQASNGKTIIEKIEEYTDDVCFGIVLYTDCDEGKAKNDKELQPRARQNVVFEHGYLISKLHRERVVAVVQDGVETPGDMNGVVYIPLDSGKTWQYTIADEMQALGLDVDKNKI